MKLAFDLTRPRAAIVVGRAGMDLYPLPDGTDTEQAGQFAAEIGGSAGNIAVALSRHCSHRCRTMRSAASFADT
jgi:hypothetical protein